MLTPIVVKHLWRRKKDFLLYFSGKNVILKLHFCSRFINVNCIEGLSVSSVSIIDIFNAIKENSFSLQKHSNFLLNFEQFHFIEM
jgi:hypothetical protein